VAEEVRALGRKAIPLVSDVSNLASVKALAEKVMTQCGRVDIVINNAAAARGNDRKPVVDLDPADWLKVLDIGLNGAFYMCKVFGRMLIDQKRGGSIVNISSIAGKRLPASAAAYASTKAGLQALTACMAQEVGRYGVRVNAVCPGVIDTYRMDDVGRGEQWAQIIQQIPMNRAGEGADIAAIVVWLCSDQGAWVTGQSWNVDGGMVVEH